MALTAKDVMARDVLNVPQGMDLRDLAKLFLEKGFTGAPVVDDLGNLVGVVSQTDLLYYHLSRDDELVLPAGFYETAKIEGHRLPKGFQIEDVNSGRVVDVMTPVVHAVVETADLPAVARVLTSKHIHRVIVRRGRQAVGVISALDLLRALPWDRTARRPVAKRTTKKAAKPRRAGKAKAKAKPKSKAPKVRRTA